MDDLLDAWEAALIAEGQACRDLVEARRQAAVVLAEINAGLDL
jgi:hypothetical protein